MTTSQSPQQPPQQPDGPLISLRAFVLIVVALLVAVAASASVYWHKQWLLAGGVAFVGALEFFKRSVK